MKQAIWRGKEIRKEQNDGSARTQWSVTPVAFHTYKRQTKKPVSQRNRQFGAGKRFVRSKATDQRERSGASLL